MVVKELLKGIAKFVEVGGGDLNVLDFEVIVDLEHQHLTNRVDTFEDGKVPTTVELAAHLPNKPRDVGVGLGEDANGAVLPTRLLKEFNLVHRTIEAFGLRNEGHDFGDASGLFQVHEGCLQLLKTPRDVEPERVGFDGTHSPNNLDQGVFERKGLVFPLHAVEQRQATTTSGDFFELLDHQHLPLKVAQSILEVTMEGFEFLTLRIVRHDLLARDVFTCRDFGEDFFFHWTDPWLRLQTEEHRNVLARGVANAVVKQAPHDDVRVELDVFPIAKVEFIDAVKQFLLLLEQDMVVERCEDVGLEGEGLVQHQILNPAVFNDLFLAAGEAVLVHLQDVLRIVGLEIEADRNHVSGLKVVKDALDQRLREGQTSVQLIRCFRTFRAQHFNQFDPQCLLRIAQLVLFPRRRFGALKFNGDVVGDAARVQVEQIVCLVPPVDGQAS